MARSTQPVSTVPGLAAACVVAALILGTLAAVAFRAEAGHGFLFADWAALRFTLTQAILSSIISVVLAVPVARALSRRRFAGRRVLIALLGAPFILPVIVAILGLLQVFGRSGWISELLAQFGAPPIRIYGMHGVVLAHVFFNLPLATRLILQGWQEVPSERFRLAAQLGCEGRSLFRLIELPMLARIVPGVAAVIFAICLTSFAVALTLGGGPRATTVELAIYQAFTYDFDLGRAALLSGLQLVLTAAAAFTALKLSREGGFGAGLDRTIHRWDGGAPIVDAIWIILAAVFLLLPLSAVVMSGLEGLFTMPPVVFKAALISVAVAAASTAILLMLALPMAATIAVRRHGLVELSGILGLAASPLVIGTGLFIIIRPVADPTSLALPVTALVNATMALPFALRILVPAAQDTVLRHGRLALSLNMKGRVFFTRILIPRMRAQIGFAAGLSAALSMGDLGVIALFADPEFATLPLQIYRLMGAYKMQAAAGGALLLLVLSMTVFWILDRGGRWHVED
ncbi:Sulfate transport system permease protein CysW [Pseudovibrio axinellae]|uniref:Sulfate transport system permease protein CysW n=1 Tax=Pseudovibrio axinellae TaxID=989403 RepID=A0A165ZSL6_9HYPH|nr:thiamine/thiamine pyrophosphate ABC transporter permease ThiP [Pseudovibrio axinellae]KZL20232.1 Sulfate transport system permease protein CysW [Pseudovibrio axinellae]SEQ61985.1 thiamine transport system permease protein [Pseudovibrio axinellae]